MVDGGMEMRWRKGGRRRTHKLAGVIGPEVLREEGKNPERAPLPALPHTCTPVFPLTQDIMVTEIQGQRTPKVNARSSLAEYSILNT
jgi:hypothetical protein